jgi:hypothetical protein
VLALTVLPLVPSDRALAHGFGARSDLPVPLWLYAYGAAAAVVFTFVLLVDARPVPHRYPRFDLLRVGWFRAVFVGGPFLFALRLLSVALFSLVVLGDQTDAGGQRRADFRLDHLVGGPELLHGSRG